MGYEKVGFNSNDFRIMYFRKIDEENKYSVINICF